MKKLINIFFVVLFLGPQISNTWVLLNYKINQRFIVENICAERDLQKNTCQGSCHLSSQLSTQRNAPENLPAEEIFIPQIQLFYQTIELSNVQFQQQNQIPFSKVKYAFSPVFTIDQPPKASGFLLV